MAFVVVYDACVLFPAPLRDLLMRVARPDLVQAKWTERVLDECFVNLAAYRPELPSERLRRTRELMIQAVRDCMVTGYEPLIDGINLPDPGDRHVLAAAIRANAQAIVTANLKDFPSAALAPYNVEALHPDEFLLGLVDLAPGVMIQVIAEQAAALRNPPHTLAMLLDTLRNNGLARTVARLRELSEK